jgi:ligand-binding sensor domain-containing protein
MPPSPGVTRLLFFLSVVSLPALAGKQRCAFEFRHFSVAEGLSHSQVNAIVQDRQGFIWFGTRAGLNRYDGYQCKVFRNDPDDSTSLSGDVILALCVTRDGLLWIGTQGKGLDCYDPVTGSIAHVRLSGVIGQPSVISFLEEPDGSLLTGTSQGLYRVLRNGPRPSTTLLPDSAVDDPSDGWNTVRTIAEDAGGNLWMGTEVGVKMLENGGRTGGAFRRITPYRGPGPPMAAGIVNSIVRDSLGWIWIGTRRGSVWRVNPETQANEEVLSDVQVRDLMVDRAGNVWAGTIDRGLFRIEIDPHGGLETCNLVHEPDNPASLGANEVGSIFEDRSGKLWIGTNGAGVSIIDPIGRKFLHYHHIPNDPNSLADNLVRGLAEDPHGNLWIATFGGGLNVLQQKGDRFRRISDSKGEARDHQVTSIVARRNGEVWAGFAFSGLLRIAPDGRHQRRYRHTPGDPGGLAGINVIRTMIEDRSGDLWIGTHGFGLLRYRQSPENFARYNARQRDSTTLSSNHIWALFEDSKGFLWAGSWNRGISRLDPSRGSFEQFIHRRGDSTSISDYPVLCITEDRAGRIWIGSAGGGLQMIAPPYRSFVRYTAGHGFTDNMVYGILVDRTNCLWVSTSKGLTRFDPSSGDLRVFDENDGVQSREFVQGACCLGSDGRMYFGGINGFNAFHPDSIAINPVPPPVVITRFSVFDTEIRLPRSITATSAITLGREQNFFSFEFTALDYTAPAKNRYAYRLEGFDRDWVDAGTRRLATYTNVGPGEYLFRVRGSNNDGIWNNAGAALTVTVLPAVWETWWFRILIAAAIAGFIYAIYANRINKILAVERTRERIARDLHDEISATLSGISFFSRAVHTDPQNALSEQSAHFMSLIHQSSTDILELLHDIIWSINPQGDHFDNIVAKCRRYASDLCESRSIRHDIVVPEIVPTRSVDTERRKNFWLLYKEMVTNAVKHSNCSALTIRLAFEPNGMVRLHLADNGTGFDPSVKTAQHGLKNIRSRAEFLGADLALHTAPGKGTTWEFACRL